MGPQTPSLPEPFVAFEQAWQGSVQDELQQVRSTQKPLAQSAEAEQVSPRVPLGTHAPALQNALSMQLVDVEHEVAHTGPPQRNVPQSALLLGRHAPQPSHAIPVTIDRFASALSVQYVAPHALPLA